MGRSIFKYQCGLDEIITVNLLIHYVLIKINKFYFLTKCPLIYEWPWYKLDFYWLWIYTTVTTPYSSFTYTRSWCIFDSSSKYIVHLILIGGINPFSEIINFSFFLTYALLMEIIPNLSARTRWTVSNTVRHVARRNCLQVVHVVVVLCLVTRAPFDFNVATPFAAAVTRVARSTDLNHLWPGIRGWKLISITSIDDVISN